MPDNDDNVISHAFFHPSVYSCSDLCGMSVTCGGLWSALSSFVTKGSLCTFGLSVPASACLKACRLVPTSPNWLRIGCWSSGVALAWENRWLASSRQAFSSWFLVFTSCLPFGVGPITLISAPDRSVSCCVARTSRAVFLAFSAIWCCFHNDFTLLSFAWACAWISPAIHVSHHSGSAFMRLKCWYAS